MSTMTANPPVHLSPAQVLLPIMAAVLAGFLIIGLALPVLPIHVHHALGFSSFVVGLVAGSQFAASLFSRLWAGSHADHHGAKRAVITGLVGAASAGLLYLASIAFVSKPLVSVAILLLGRGVLGGAESFIISSRHRRVGWHGLRNRQGVCRKRRFGGSGRHQPGNSGEGDGQPPVRQAQGARRDLRRVG
jgi:hypothetical protein